MNTLNDSMDPLSSGTKSSARQKRSLYLGLSSATFSSLSYFYMAMS